MRSVYTRINQLEQWFAALPIMRIFDWHMHEEWLRSLSDDQLDELLTDLESGSALKVCSEETRGLPSAALANREPEATLCVKLEYWSRKLMEFRADD